ncbi:hypothetical protein HTZ77_15930 [Nonomuraea sp. SMC257]|uniref:Uncharacterized protein n=1 Tax=Nonomuraea montanisoli TaxID=2741721 RepID=A0A7Y6M2Q1_9ACTN|nr:hypothetical protein [Nonomuraea montanisoli]NUW32913.1 hypothetical protein [Nonomuraea montanisoli]
MDQTRKMWASAAVVGVIVVGGVSVAAAASAGRLEKVSKETKAVVQVDPGQVAELTGQTPAPSPDTVVSRDVNPDPDAVLDYWTDKRMEDAEPMPMPEGEPVKVTEGPARGAPDGKPGQVSGN